MDASVTIQVRVQDKERLYKTALEHAVAANGLDEELAESILKPGGEVSVQACLRELFDPGQSPEGCEIQDSNVELL